MTAKIKKPPKRYHHHPYRPRGVSHKAFRKVYWPYIPMILLIGLLVSLSSSVGTMSAMARDPIGQVLAYSSTMSKSGLLAGTNAARVENGTPQLVISNKLNAAAQAKADDMAERNYWSHNTPEGRTPWVFVTAQKYAYYKLGENLAAGFDNEQATINGWLSSPSHRANLLDRSFTQVGFGYANNANYTAAGGGPMTIVVAFYGRPQVLSATASPASNTRSRPTPSVAPPINTEQAVPAVPLTTSPSRAKVALAGTSVAGVATVLVVALAVAAGGIWISRHVITLRRVLVHGEAFVLRHPLMDIGLIVIAALSFLLTRSAGLIQ